MADIYNTEMIMLENEQLKRLNNELKGIIVHYKYLLDKYSVLAAIEIEFEEELEDDS